MDDIYDLPPGVDLSGGGDAGDAPILRCWPETDSITTVGEQGGARYICLSWAQGSCANGAMCQLCHRLPTLADEQRLLYSQEGRTHDVFGRPFTRLVAGAETASAAVDNSLAQTVQVTGLPATDSHNERRTLLNLLTEWGDIVKVWLVADPRVGYVKFKWRGTAQFVMEAMHRRPLCPEIPDATIELAWCHVDPSAIQATQGREMALALAADAAARRQSQQELYSHYERAKSVNDSSAALPPRAQKKRPRSVDAPEGGSVAAAWAEEPEVPISSVAALYPNGDGAGYGQQHASEQAAQQADAEAPATTQPDSGGQESTQPGLPEGWVSGTDPASQFTYYYHMPSGKSQWELPSA